MNSQIERCLVMWRRADPSLRRRVILMYALLITFNLAVWAVVLASSAKYGLLLGLAPLAYGFGLRHAVDPDHIAAIDNTTRKLMQDGKRPLGVGLFFSLGHSTVVFCFSIAIAVSAAFVKHHLPSLRAVGAVAGTSVSGLFLVAIAAINLVVLFELWRTWGKVVRGGNYDERSLEEYLRQRGLLARLFRPLLVLVRSSWHMYPIGILFGLGFDTATEVGILGMSATAGAGGMPVWFILLLPMLYVAGMSLVDTTDGIAMLGAYGWAYVRPVRKLYYNMSITLISALVAVFVGGVELLQVLGTELGARGSMWTWAGDLPFNSLGFFILALFAASWLASVAIYKLRGIDRIDDELKLRALPRRA